MAQAIELLLLALFFTILGMAYVKGYDVVKARSAAHLPHYYLIAATVRMMLVLTVVGIYVLLTDSRDDAIRFAIACMLMYVAMMAVTLSLRH